MTKGELMKIVFDNDTSGVDTSVPQSFFDTIKKEGLDPSSFVWSYKENKVWGSPVNLYEAYAKRLIEQSEKVS